MCNKESLTFFQYHFEMLMSLFPKSVPLFAYCSLLIHSETLKEASYLYFGCSLLNYLYYLLMKSKPKALHSNMFVI